MTSAPPWPHPSTTPYPTPPPPPPQPVWACLPSFFSLPRSWRRHCLSDPVCPVLSATTWCVSHLDSQPPVLFSIGFSQGLGPLPSVSPQRWKRNAKPAHSSHSTIYSLLHPNWTSWQSIFLFLSFWRPFFQVHLMTSIFQPSLMGFWEMPQSSEDVWMCMFFSLPLQKKNKKKKLLSTMVTQRKHL